MQWYDPNNVTSDNFNETMFGYVNYAIKAVEKVLQDDEYSKQQIDDIKSIIKSCMNFAVDMMTMEEARKYLNRRLWDEKTTRPDNNYK